MWWPDFCLSAVHWEIYELEKGDLKKKPSAHMELKAGCWMKCVAYGQSKAHAKINGKFNVCFNTEQEDRINV